VNLPRYVLFCSLTFALGCPSGEADDDDDAALPDSYQDMDRAQRTTYMEQTVLPAMQELFSAYNPFFPELECETCHGADLEDPDVDYAMPNGVTGIPFGFFVTGSPSARLTGWAEFMEDEVLPAMVELLDETEFDPGSGEGFGCFGCHENYTPGAASWQDLETLTEQREFMNWEVLPPMADAFQAFDADEFAEFDCETCHGDDMWQVEFEMPNGNTELPFDGFPFSESDDLEEAAFGEFMEDDVLPDMVELLDEEEYDPQTGTGFGCYECHERPGN